MRPSLIRASLSESAQQKSCESNTNCDRRLGWYLEPGYGRLILARGTLTLLNNALLSAHFRVADNPPVEKLRLVWPTYQRLAQESRMQ
jgi:hypothetical protein